MIDVKVNKDNSEIISYDETGIPIYIREGYLSLYPNYRELCHWHEDIEFIYVLEGKMNYYVNGKVILLKSGESVMINSGQLHYGYSTTKEECRFYCVLLHPSLITMNKSLYEKFVEPVTKNQGMDYLVFDREEAAGEILKEMYRLKMCQSVTYELEVIQLFHRLWKNIYEIAVTKYEDVKQPVDHELQAQRQMVSFIYCNYSAGILLDDIAAAGKVCRSKCCQIFKKYAGESPMDFVNEYRLEVSCQMLLATDLNITEICIACGFNHSSYFSKMFKEKYGCTPKEYRRLCI